MITLFAHDLKAARRKAGLSQRDVSILLNAGDKELLALESGKRLPSVPQIIKLGLIFNRTFASLFEAVRLIAKRELFQQIPSLPEPKGGSLSNFNRDNTLKRLEARLADDLAAGNGAA